MKLRRAFLFVAIASLAAAGLALLIFAGRLQGETELRRLEKLVPLVYPIDTSAPVAFRQWPIASTDVPSPPMHGVAFMLWSDHATLLVDRIPLQQQLDWLPFILSPRLTARLVRVRRWELSSERCAAIPSLFEELRTLPGVPREIVPTEIDRLYAVTTRQELFVRREGKRIVFVTQYGFTSHARWLERVWRELDACAKGRPAAAVKPGGERQRLAPFPMLAHDSG